MCERCAQDLPIRYVIESDCLRLCVCRACGEYALRLMKDPDYIEGKLTRISSLTVVAPCG
jgi:hypothetical protein